MYLRLLFPISLFLHSALGSCDEGNNVSLKVINPTQNAVVVGLCSPQDSGIEEIRLAVPAETEVTNVALPYSEHDQFAVVYRAQMSDGELIRSVPFEVVALGKISTLGSGKTRVAMINVMGAYSPRTLGSMSLIRKAHHPHLKNTIEYRPHQEEMDKAER